jgi:membrane-bound lytic murein transglycosylase D
VLHHPEYLSIVYDVVDLSDISRDPRLDPIERELAAEKRVDARREEVTAALRKLATDPNANSLTDEEWRVKRLFRNVSEHDAFKKAADVYGVRSQTGQSDKFIAGLKYSGKYLGEIEKIYEQYGLPRELTRLIFVESMFDIKAKSSVGASGIWQFMPDTGKLYLSMNDIVDDRNDPIAATHASARLLRQNMDELGSWPLAINAYNTGRGRISQAVKALGTTDIARIIREFEHGSYGFASRNFFLEYLAALDVAEHSDRHFGPIKFDDPLRFEVIRCPYHLSIPNVAELSGIPLDDIAELNPALRTEVIGGKRPLPQGFELRLPEGKTEVFLAAAARSPESRSGPVKHVVKSGENLNSIASMYGTTADELRSANAGVRTVPRLGQVLVIPYKN